MGWVVNVMPGLLKPLERDPVPILQEAGWAQGQSRQVQNISPPSAVGPRTIQPIASCYINCVILAPHVSKGERLKW